MVTAGKMLGTQAEARICSILTASWRELNLLNFPVRILQAPINKIGGSGLAPQLANSEKSICALSN
jgi:hypothetical protein